MSPAGRRGGAVSRIHDTVTEKESLSMSIDRIVMAFAGAVVLVTAAIALFTPVQWVLWITAFVGLNLFQAAFTGFCPLAIILKKVGARPGVAFS